MKFQKQLPLDFGAWSVTQIKRDTIALTFPFQKFIGMFNMDNETITKVIRLDKHCYGLVFSKNALVVGLSKNEIRVLDLEGNTQKSIEVRSNSQLYHLVYFNDKAIFSDNRGKSVSCVDGSGKQVWQYQHDLSGPSGLCADTYGNIIVEDRDSHRILVIAKDGQDSKVLIHEEDGRTGNRYSCICFYGSSGFICDRFITHVPCTSITKFNLSYE